MMIAAASRRDREGEWPHRRGSDEQWQAPRSPLDRARTARRAAPAAWPCAARVGPRTRIRGDPCWWLGR